MSEDSKEGKSPSMSHNISQRLALNIDSHIVSMQVQVPAKLEP